MNSPIDKNQGFSLIELMVVVVIIGVLAALAAGSYNRYKINTKMTEAYTMMSVIEKNEISYFYENKQFVIVTPSPKAMSQTMVLAASPTSWLPLAPPAAVNSHVWFYYSVRAGKTDGAGTELGSSSGFALLNEAANLLGIRYADSPTTGCTTDMGVVNPASFGLVAQPNYDWMVISAISDLNADHGSLCTGVIRMTHATNANNKTPAAVSGFIQLNVGD